MTVDASANGKAGREKAVSRSVCVIGAGAAGLVAVRELREEGHRVTAFEQVSMLRLSTTCCTTFGATHESSVVSGGLLTSFKSYHHLQAYKIDASFNKSRMRALLGGSTTISR